MWSEWDVCGDCMWRTCRDISLSPFHFVLAASIGHTCVMWMLYDRHSSHLSDTQKVDTPIVQLPCSFIACPPSLSSSHPPHAAHSSETLAHLLFAAADVILVPSMFEPCGLTQMIGMRYGVVSGKEVPVEACRSYLIS